MPGLAARPQPVGCAALTGFCAAPSTWFVLELGANDGLRGIDPKDTRANLQQIVERVQAKNPQVALVIAGMLMPPNLGAEYTEAFAAIFPALAKEKRRGLDSLFVGRRGRPTRAEPARRQPSQRRRPPDRRRNRVGDAGAGAGEAAPLTERAPGLRAVGCGGRRGWRPCQRQRLTD